MDGNLTKIYSTAPVYSTRVNVRNIHQNLLYCASLLYMRQCTQHTPKSIYATYAKNRLYCASLLYMRQCTQHTPKIDSTAPVYSTCVNVRNIRQKSTLPRQSTLRASMYATYTAPVYSTCVNVRNIHLIYSTYTKIYSTPVSHTESRQYVSIYVRSPTGRSLTHTILFSLFPVSSTSLPPSFLLFERRKLRGPHFEERPRSCQYIDYVQGPALPDPPLSATADCPTAGRWGGLTH